MSTKAKVVAWGDGIKIDLTPTSIASILKALLADAEEVAPETFAECTTSVEGYDYGRAQAYRFCLKRAQAYRFCLKLIETVES